MTPGSRPPPAAARAVALANRVANRCLLPLLERTSGGPLGRRLAVLDYQGRRTGGRHRLVTLYSTDGSTVHITVGMPEHKTWWRNFETPRPLRLRLAGVDHEAVGHVVREQGRLGVVADLAPEAASAAVRPSPTLRGRTA